MRAAAFLAGSIIAIGIHLALAAALGFPPALIGIGVLAIGVVAALGLMAGDRQPVRPARA